MKLVSHKELHNEWMQDDEYRAAWQEEERKEKLRDCLLYTSDAADELRGV